MPCWRPGFKLAHIVVKHHIELASLSHFGKWRGHLRGLDYEPIQFAYWGISREEGNGFHRGLDSLIPMKNQQIRGLLRHAIPHSQGIAHYEVGNLNPKPQFPKTGPYIQPPVAPLKEPSCRKSEGLFINIALCEWGVWFSALRGSGLISELT